VRYLVSLVIARIELTEPIRLKVICNDCHAETYASVDTGGQIPAVHWAEWGTYAEPDFLTIEALAEALTRVLGHVCR
jgi:hypothetical protein